MLRFCFKCLNRDLFVKLVHHVNLFVIKGVHCYGAL